MAGATAAGLVGVAALPILAGVASLGLVGLGIYKLVNRFKGSIKSSMSEEQKE